MVLDTDEFLAAQAAGYMTAEEAAGAITTLHGLLNGLAKNGYSLETYLATHNIILEWV